MLISTNPSPEVYVSHVHQRQFVIQRLIRVENVNLLKNYI